MKYKKAVFPGSFDPMHIGHLNILQKANNIFDEVYIVISNNPDKQSTSLIERQEQVISFLREHNFKNEVIINEGLTIDIAKKYGCQFLVRGVRNSRDFEFELKLQQENKKIDSNIETILIFPDQDYFEISSSGLK